MKDSECVQFLQWALPRLHMRWPGFRKVRAQVCKRIGRRMRQLRLISEAEYRSYLEQHPGEWEVVDSLTHVTISRFYRDKAMFAFLESDVIPALARQATERGRKKLRIWSAGCSSGEEPYTLSFLWKARLLARFPGLALEIVATDVDSHMIRRSGTGCYLYSSIKNLPADWRDQAFYQNENLFCLKEEYRERVQFRVQDVREELPPGSFDLVLCRNLVFTYFQEMQQRQILGRIREAMQPGGALVIGIHEDLPEDVQGFTFWSERLRVFRKDVDSR